MCRVRKLAETRSVCGWDRAAWTATKRCGASSATWLACSLGFVLAVLVTAANVHGTQPAAALLALAAQGGWTIGRVKVDGIYIGPRMAQAAQDHGVDVQVTTRDADVKGFKPLPLRWRIEATFSTLSSRWHRLTRNLGQSPAAAEDAVVIANCHRLLRAYHRPEYITA